MPSLRSISFALPFLVAGCTGPTGPQGAQGEGGAAGPPGEAGMMGAQGTPGANAEAGVGVAVSCMSPCHGFNGVVSQFQSERALHRVPGERRLGDPRGGVDHAQEPLRQLPRDRRRSQQRVAGNVGTTDGGGRGQPRERRAAVPRPPDGRAERATTPGSATVAEVYCTTCHAVTNANDPHMTGIAWTPGSFPLQVVDRTAAAIFIEKSPTTAAGRRGDANGGDYGPGNTCMWCHRSRVDVTNYIDARRQQDHERALGPARGAAGRSLHRPGRLHSSRARRTRNRRTSRSCPASTAT